MEREAPDQLYVVEIEGRVEAFARPEDLAPDREAVPSAGGQRALEGPREQVEEVVEALHGRRRVVGTVQGAGDVEATSFEFHEKALEEPPGQPDVGVDEEQDVAASRPPASLPRATGGSASRSATKGKRPATVTVASSEPASTTSTWSGLIVCAATSESKGPRWRSSFNVGITTLNPLTTLLSAGAKSCAI